MMQQEAGDRCAIASDYARRSVLRSHLGGRIHQRSLELGYTSEASDFGEIRTQPRPVSPDLMTGQALTAALEESLASGGVTGCTRFLARRHRPEVGHNQRRLPARVVARWHGRPRYATTNDVGELRVRRRAANTSLAEIHAGYGITIGTVTVSAGPQI